MVKYIAVIVIVVLFMLSCGDGQGSKGVSKGDKKTETKSKEPEKAKVTYEIKDTKKKSKIKIGERSLGRAVVGEVLHDNFALKNMSETPLVILNIKSNCGCIFMDYGADPIKKEESRIIKYKYKAGRKKGAHFSEITIKTNKGTYSVLVDIEIK